MRYSLIAEKWDLDFKPAARLEQVGEELSKGMKDRKHCFTCCDDSIPARESRPDGIFGKDNM
jgi:hypothetical protein